MTFIGLPLVRSIMGEKESFRLVGYNGYFLSQYKFNTKKRFRKKCEIVFSILINGN
ncbi:hypothetical protein Hs30E_08550 [Lactococcus hodotermopsidis]|uniref:Uncharacterized protein n=1 Tax=Pseudolactococcus hodotermopsidis TaxID=2709157 RepID=A0A6A0BCY3_9LACT|nr:hypothetical protein Hs30E_08550 [Lactococcus hodotermopsidis]